jgi:alkylation response protein AidB-like acyl-CoA dehydrogenase
MGEEGKGFPYIMQHFALERLIMAINGHARAEYALEFTHWTKRGFWNNR